MKISLDIPTGVRVVPTSDRKGNPVTYLEIMGVPVLYASGETPGGIDAECWEDIFSNRLASILGKLLLDNSNDNLKEWSTASPTGREVNHNPHVDYVREEY